MLQSVRNQAEKLVQRAATLRADLKDGIEDRISQVARRVGLVTHTELRHFKRLVRELENQVGTLEAELAQERSRADRAEKAAGSVDARAKKAADEAAAQARQLADAERRLADATKRLADLEKSAKVAQSEQPTLALDDAEDAPKRAAPAKKAPAKRKTATKKAAAKKADETADDAS